MVANGEGEGILGRSMRILACFTADEPDLSATRLAEQTALSPSTLHRILAQLVEHGLLARAPERRYIVGPRLWELGELSPLSLRLRETALPHMQRLYEATGENVHLAVLDAPTPERATALYVGRVTGHGSIPTLSRMGGRHPLHTVGVGKAMLAQQGEEWLRQYFRVPLERETMHSLTSETALRADLEATSARGYAVAREEMTLGNISIATMLGHVRGLPATAIGVVAHIDTADERRLAALVRQAAGALTRELREA